MQGRKTRARSENKCSSTLFHFSSLNFSYSSNVIRLTWPPLVHGASPSLIGRAIAPPSLRPVVGGEGGMDRKASRAPSLSACTLGTCTLLYTHTESSSLSLSALLVGVGLEIRRIRCVGGDDDDEDDELRRLVSGKSVAAVS